MAGLLASWEHDDPLVVVPTLVNRKLVPAMICELVGTFFLSLMVLVNTEDSTNFSKQHWITAVLIGLSLSAAVYPSATASNAIYNPQISIGLELTGLVHGASYDPYIKHFYIYLIFPPLGALLSVLFFEFFYKPQHVEKFRLSKLSENTDMERLNMT